MGKGHSGRSWLIASWTIPSMTQCKVCLPLCVCEREWEQEKVHKVKPHTFIVIKLPQQKQVSSLGKNR